MGIASLVLALNVYWLPIRYVLVYDVVYAVVSKHLWMTEYKKHRCIRMEVKHGHHPHANEPKTEYLCYE